jgi:hypothetical protein
VQSGRLVVNQVHQGCVGCCRVTADDIQRDIAEAAEAHARRFPSTQVIRSPQPFGLHRLWKLFGSCGQPSATRKKCKKVPPKSKALQGPQLFLDLLSHKYLSQLLLQRSAIYPFASLCPRAVRARVELRTASSTLEIHPDPRVATPDQISGVYTRGFQSRIEL